VALLVDQVGGDYQTGLLHAVEDAARQFDVNLLVAAGCSLHAPNPAEAAQNDVYAQLGADRLDGVVVASGTICSHVTPRTLADFFTSFSGLALCSVSANVVGVPSVAASNRRGMRIVVEHIIVAHGCKRIAYVRGPIGGNEGQERFEGYVSALKDRGLAFDPALVETGDFRIASGAEAVARLLDAGTPFDALVAANDYMAVGAMGELRGRGKRIPRDLLVAGFDDAPLGRIASPSLTTVRQPLQRLGVASMETVLRQIAGGHVEERVELDVDLVTRQSCGCSYGAVQQHPATGRTALPSLRELEASGVLVALESKSDELCQALRRCIAAPPALVMDWSERLMSALRAEFSGGAGRFLLDLGDVLDEAQRFGETVHRFSSVISLWRRLLRHAVADVAQVCLLDDVWHAAMVLVEAEADRSHKRFVFESEHAQNVQRESVERLSTVLSVPALKDALKDVLPALGIHSAIVSAYEGDGRSRLRPLVVVGDRVGSPPLGDPFPARRLAPDAFFRTDCRWTHVAVHLSLGTEHLGLALLEGGGRPSVYRMLRDQITFCLARSTRDTVGWTRSLPRAKPRSHL
jgi:sigma-B regulation protein RsbU (phosphoserine phosphatase)